MAFEITMPQLGLTMEEGTVSKWLKKEGDAVKAGEAILEITTDKLTNEVVSEHDGVLLKIVAQEDEDIPVKGLLGYIGQPGEQVGGAAPAAPAAAPAAAAAPAKPAGDKRVIVIGGGPGGYVAAIRLAQLGAKKRSLEVMNMFGLYQSGTKVTDKPEILFARMDIKDVMEKVEAMKAAAAAEKQEEEKPGMDVEKKPEITYDDFAKLQFQIGEIVKCEEVPKSKKLLCSQVKIGSETRQILSGIKAWYKPEDMVGRKVMVVTNLKPAKLAGMLSEGMILCAEDDEGNLALMTPAKDIKSGSEVC